MTQSEAGKGSKRRPAQVSDEQFATRWDAIWGQRDSKKQLRMDKDVCSVCGRHMVDGICPEQLRQQQERT